MQFIHIPTTLIIKNYYLNFGGNHFVNDQLSIQGNMYYRHMERRNYNGDEFEGKDCGLDFDRGVVQLMELFAVNMNLMQLATVSQS